MSRGVTVYPFPLNPLQVHKFHTFGLLSKEAFVAKPQAKHLQKIYPDIKVEVFPKMNHGQLLVDHPEEVAGRIVTIYLWKMSPVGAGFPRRDKSEEFK